MYVVDECECDYDCMKVCGCVVCIGIKVSKILFFIIWNLSILFRR